VCLFVRALLAQEILPVGERGQFGAEGHEGGHAILGPGVFASQW